jgi:hypothetical protein
MRAVSILDPSGSVVRKKILGSRCTIGRTKGDITFPDDKGVSRQHAILSITDRSISIIDSNSTAGTLVNGVRIAPGQERSVGDGDIVTLGVSQPPLSRLEIIASPVIVCSSRLERSNEQLYCTSPNMMLWLYLGDRERVRSSLEVLGAQFADRPENCTHLICSKFSITTKVLGAIVHRKPIVTPAWLADMAEVYSRAVDTMSESTPAALDWLPENRCAISRLIFIFTFLA